MTPRTSTPAASAEKRRVLIVDDDARSSEAMALVFRLRGFPCIAVASEAHAFASMEDFRPDVVILEWASRTKREVERARRLRAFAEARGRTVTIIVVTHEITLPPADALSSVGAYFTKPVVLERLEQTIETLTAPIQRARAG